MASPSRVTIGPNCGPLREAVCGPYWPTADGTGSDEFRRALQALGDRSALDTKVASFVKATPGAGTTYSDWVVIVE
jgi:hypothetical protein